MPAQASKEIVKLDQFARRTIYTTSSSFKSGWESAPMLTVILLFLSPYITGACSVHSSDRCYL